MKKLLAIIVVLALVAPAMAASVTVSEGTGGAGEAVIVLTADAGIVGVGLTVDASADVTDWAVDSFFDVFIDAAFDIGPTYVIGNGSPIADQTGAGEVGLPASIFSISMGGLDDDGILAGTEEAPLVTSIVLTGSGTAVIDEDTLRGGIVGYDGAMTISGLPLTVTFAGGVVECMAGTNPDKTDWDFYGQPDCWCFKKHCRGDADGADEFGYPVLSNDLAALAAAYAKADTDAGFDICADFAHDAEFGYRVLSNDLALLAGNYAGTPADCSGPGSGNDENPLPNSEFNFWTN